MSRFILVDPRVQDYERLIAGLEPGVQLVVLDPIRDGITQIAAAFAGVTDLDSIHIISHGSGGTLYIGSTVLTSENLDNHDSDLSRIGAALSESGDILLYGCNVGAGEGGRGFIGSLADYTGADVAASDDATGALILGGDWVLEAISGTIESGLAIGSVAQGVYGYTLDTITGTSGNDALTGSAGEDLLNGLGGRDILDGGGSSDTIVGGPGKDTLLGGNGGDRLRGGAGSDSFNGGAGADVMMGGAGNDRYMVERGSDVVTELPGEGARDTILSSVNYTLPDEVEWLMLTGTANLKGTGNALDNDMAGNGGNNVLDGGGGNDTLTGGARNDTYIVNAAGDVVQEDAAAGRDLVKSSIDYSLGPNVERLTLTGADNIDGAGNALNNLLTGNGADNVLNGGGGNDMLHGGFGADSLIGGAGNDTLVWDVADNKVNGGMHIDTLWVSSWTPAVDLTTVPDTIIVNVETISLAGRITLTLALADVMALSDRTDTLRVTGGAGDLVIARDIGWAQIADITLGGQVYAQYTKGGAVLQVDVDIDRSGIADTAPPITSEILVAHLDGSNGFAMKGIDADDWSGYSVASAGDVNGDGFDDLIIGAPGADPGGVSQAGESYVVFGKASGFVSSLGLSALDGADGFVLNGIDTDDLSGHWVASAGDVNGDGFDDLIIGANRADPGGASAAGESYVVFGKASGFASSLELSALDGASGFVLNGIDAGDWSGYSVAAAGDVNGDGFDDLIIGAYRAAPGDDSHAGESYVVFGKASGSGSSLDLSALDGSNGFVLNGIDAGDESGYSVAAAGDVNGDGFDDLIIGAPFAEPGGDFWAGESYMVFGKASGFAASFELSALNGSNGFVLNGIDRGDVSGLSVASAGDVNGDGFDDLIIGAPWADQGPGGDYYDLSQGEAYVVFGKAAGFAASFDLSTLNGTNGFVVTGVDYYDSSGSSVASAGDVNGDGFDDLMVGAYGADLGGSSSAGETYVVFGKASGFPSSLALSSIDGTNGFVVKGVVERGYLGGSVAAAGDVNGDGFDDLILGANGADPHGKSGAGESYVVLGGDFTGAVAYLGTAGAETLTGGAAAEIFVAGEGNDTLIGGGGADVFRAGAGDDLIRVTNTTFRDVDGGSGTDTLRLMGGGRTLDLSTLANNRIGGIEIIDFAGSGDNTLKLSALDLFDLSDTSNQLTVDGNSSDTVDLVGTWDDGGADAAYHTYTLGAATILIDNDIFVT